MRMDMFAHATTLLINPLFEGRLVEKAQQDAQEKNEHSEDQTPYLLDPRLEKLAQCDDRAVNLPLRPIKKAHLGVEGATRDRWRTQVFGKASNSV